MRITPHAITPICVGAVVFAPASWLGEDAVYTGIIWLLPPWLLSALAVCVAGECIALCAYLFARRDRLILHPSDLGVMGAVFAFVAFHYALIQLGELDMTRAIALSRLSWALLMGSLLFSMTSHGVHIIRFDHAKGN